MCTTGIHSNVTIVIRQLCHGRNVLQCKEHDMRVTTISMVKLNWLPEDIRSTTMVHET
uniref:Uncharacterized protein n=1 Tax=Arundo donax TaxID=35708 RepID=A0A0A9HDM7_ARUDO